MNQQERDALREKHRCLESKVGPWCRSCMHGWPCDTIHALNLYDDLVDNARFMLKEVTPSEYGSAYAHGYRVALQDMIGEDDLYGERLAEAVSTTEPTEEVMPSHTIASHTFQPPKFKVGDKVRVIGNPEWGDLTVTQVDTVYTVVDSKGRDDAWVEAELIATPPPCQHIVGTELPPTATNPQFQWFDYTYCPLCGEKLTPTGTTVTKEGGNL